MCEIRGVAWLQRKLFSLSVSLECASYKANRELGVVEWSGDFVCGYEVIVQVVGVCCKVQSISHTSPVVLRGTSVVDGDL